MLPDLFLHLHLDFSLIGLEQREDADAYYCTPKDADILGWAGVDGIHYCTIPEFGEMVFAVNPMNFEDCVHPIARSLQDLFSLLLTCGDMAALEQCYAWDRPQYDAFLMDNPVSADQRRLLDRIQEEIGVEPIQDVFSYVKALQAKFDLTQIPYTEDYYDFDMNPVAPMPPEEWEVTYGGGLWSPIGEPGHEVALNREFQWNQEKWFIPSMYLCAEGVVMDYLTQVEPEKVQSFLQKWHLENGAEPVDEAIAEQIQRENPLTVDFYGEVQYNQLPLHRDHSCSVSWLPESCRIPGWDLDIEAQAIVDHYDLDREKAWVFHRVSYRWSDLSDHEPCSLSIRMVRIPERVPGASFEIGSEGTQVSLLHPVTGVHHTLTVKEYCLQRLSDSSFPQNHMDYPPCCVMMSFSLEPELPASEFFLQDLSPSDPPRPQKQEKTALGPESDSSVMMGIIGGSDGPTVLMTGTASQRKRSPRSSLSNTARLHHACSSLHYEPMEKVIWTPVFQVKRMEDLQVSLLPKKN